jgi:hypothetical protein
MADLTVRTFDAKTISIPQDTIAALRGIRTGQNVLSNGSQGVFSKPSQYTKLSGAVWWRTQPISNRSPPQIP